MRINTRVRYAIRMMTDLARHELEKPVALRDVAQRQHLPKLYLSQLVGPLKRASLLKSVWGNKGGYALARPAAEIRLLDIIEAVDGPVALMDCLSDGESCERSDYCECIGVWRDINAAIVAILEKHTLARLAGGRSDVSLAGGSCRVIAPKPEVRNELSRRGSGKSGQKRRRQVRAARKR